MQQYNGGNDPQRGGVYSMGHGFCNPYAEPEWKREKRRIRSAGNGIGPGIQPPKAGRQVGIDAAEIGASLLDLP